MSIRVMLVDDHTITRDGLRTLLEHEADIQVVGEAADGRQALQLVRNLHPDVVVMDVAMPELNGIEATRRITAEFPDVRIIALTMYTSRRYVRGILGAGALGFLAKNCPSDELLQAIRTVILNRTFISASISGDILDDYRRESQPAFTHDQVVLTLREQDVLKMLAEGDSIRTIADKLAVSLKTVESHRQNILKKLKIDSMANLVKWAIREGLTTVNAEDSLSPREREMLQMFTEGKQPRQIAEILCLSVHTVHTHRKNIMHKLHVDNLADLVKYAIRAGITSLEA